MYKACVFAGTTEGRQLAEFLAAQGVGVTACVATEYGGELLTPAENLTVSAKRLPPEEIAALLRAERFDVVVDATHPYAAHITESIAAACRAEGADCLRLLRAEGVTPEGTVFVADAAAAVDYLKETEGNILLTTGSKELPVYAQLPDFAERVWVRVLPMDSSLASCREAGLKPAHILALQGPFSEELNIAMLHAVGARWLVTKDGGGAGGFAEKASAAEKTGARLVVIGRPPQHEGLTLAETVTELCRRFALKPRPQVAVVGIGPGSRGAMTADALAAAEQAELLIGAKRMLESVARPGQATEDAIAPEKIAAAIAAHPEAQRIAVLMSGDVGFFSGTKKLLPLLADCETRVIPGLSSLVTLCARLGKSYEDAVPVSLHGREHNIVSDVRANRRVFALVGGTDGMRKLCADLASAGLGAVRVSVGERLSYPDERITSGTAAELQSGAFAPLSVALIENDAADRSVVTPGLPDEAFLRGETVPMTKSEVRAVCLAKLRLSRGAVCWDVGAGTGSVSVEMALAAARGEVWAVERKDEAVELLKENCARFALNNLHVVPGLAPEACRDLPAPTHVFLGGTTGRAREIIALALEKNPSVRIVATAIALESAAELTGLMKEFDFTEREVVTLSVARSRKAGPYQLMIGQNPIQIFTMQRAGGDG